MSYAAELSRARRQNRRLSNVRLREVRCKTENLKLKRGVLRFKVSHEFRCGKAADIVIAQLLLSFPETELTEKQRNFRMMSLLHVGVLNMPCPTCMKLVRLYDLYKTWWREGIVLEAWERVWSLDPTHMRKSEISQVAWVIRRRRALLSVAS